MALTIYPADNYDSFIAEADATSFLALSVPPSQLTAWNALDVATREIYLRQATTLIKQKITLPETNEDNLKCACAYLANYSIDIDMLNTDSESNLKRINIADSEIEKEWFSPNKSANQFPTIVSDLLSGYGYSSGGSFVLARA